MPSTSILPNNISVGVNGSFLEHMGLSAKTEQFYKSLGTKIWQEITVIQLSFTVLIAVKAALIYVVCYQQLLSLWRVAMCCAGNMTA